MGHTLQKIIERFHLLLLQQLGARLDKKLYVLKGGCNLRFFFQSIRYSEDCDIDVQTIAVGTLSKKIDKLLTSLDFQKILYSHGIEIVQVNASKQTATTQRWKLTLKNKQITLPIPTKIEFSRRKVDDGFSYEAVDTKLLSEYRFYPVLLNHYNKQTALLQKINALQYRTETQARDVFDLKWLIDRGVTLEKNNALSAKNKALVTERIQELTYDDFKGQVVAYLMEEYQTYYDTKIRWQEIQKAVTLFLADKIA